MRCSRNFFGLFLLTLVSFHPAAQKKSSLELYGAVIADAGYNFTTIDPLWFDVMRPVKLPSYPGQFAPDGNVFFSMRQTKFGVKSSHPVGGKELKTQFDFDLVGFGADVGQTTFHLVNAFAQYGSVAMGQMPSVFMDTDVFPQTLDYWGPASRVFILNVQLRYYLLQKEGWRLVIGLERPGATADGGDYAGRIEIPAVKPVFRLPNLTAHYRIGGRWGHIQAGGIAKSIQWKDTSGSPVYNVSGSAFAWGFNLGAVVKLTEAVTLKLQGEYGAGMENYIADAGVDIGRESNSGDPAKPVKGKPLPIFGLFGFTEINWNKKLQSSIGYSVVAIENSNLQSATAFSRGGYGLANLRYHPIDNVMVGVEYQYGRRESFQNGFASNGSKLHLAFDVAFSRLLKIE